MQKILRTKPNFYLPLIKHEAISRRCCSHFHSRYERRLIFELSSSRFYFRSLKKLILFALLRHSNMSRKSFSCRKVSCVDSFPGLFSSISKTLNFRNRLITTYKLILLLSIPCDLIQKQYLSLFALSGQFQTDRFRQSFQSSF